RAARIATSGNTIVHGRNLSAASPTRLASFNTSGRPTYHLSQSSHSTSCVKLLGPWPTYGTSQTRVSSTNAATPTRSQRRLTPAGPYSLHNHVPPTRSGNTPRGPLANTARASAT